MAGLDGRELGRLPDNSSSQAAAAANAELKGVQFRAVTAFNRLRDDIGRLGSSSDTPDLRRRIGDSGKRFNSLAQEFREKFGRHPARDSSPAQKLLRDFQSLVKSSERLMQTAKAREAATLPRQPAGPASAAAEQQEVQFAAARDMAERQALLEAQHKQELLSIENQLQFNEAVIEERDQAIGEIAGQIGEVHQIFQDLAVLVNDQGEQLDDIEANITRASERTADATVQIARAERSQRAARSRWCFLLAIAALVLGILLLIVLA